LSAQGLAIILAVIEVGHGSLGIHGLGRVGASCRARPMGKMEKKKSIKACRRIVADS
jgi:hypothetical protein